MATNAGVDVSHGLTREEGQEVFDLVLRNPLPHWLICTRDLAGVLRAPREPRQIRKPPATAAPAGK
jgi:hypothetical protein